MAIVHVLRPSILVYLLLIFPSTNSSSESEALLKLKDSFVNTTLLNSWKPGTEPCAKGREWARVLCVKGVASGLRLGNLGLSGKVDVDALISLQGLRLLSLESNRFSGPIPEFQQMVTLRGLFLSGNQFSGEIPSDYFAKLSRLKKVWLSENGFSGRVPSSLGNLSNLIELHLEDNQFSGTIPPLEQPSLVYLNISDNKLEGEIPSSMSKFSVDSFQGNPGLCGERLGKVCSLWSDGKSEKANFNNHKFLWALVPLVIVFLAMIAGIVVLKQRQDKTTALTDSRAAQMKDLNSSRGQEKLQSDHQAGPSRKGSAKDIVMMNDGVGELMISDLLKAEAVLIGNGTLGCSYKVTMANGLTVVVKRIKEMNKLARDQFDTEIRKLASLKHENLLAPMAYYYRRDEKLLIYEHLPNGSLFYMLHGQGISHAELNWPVRMKIIQGIAKGLGHIHTELSALDVPHGNLKSSNIFLTLEYEALLAEYGFSSLISSSRASAEMAAYQAPEVVLHQQISSKCDVYSLGIIILEILTGKCPNLYDGVDGVDVVQLVRSVVDEGRLAGLVDPELASDERCLGEMEEVLEIGVACTESNPEQRLDITEAVRRIESIPVDGSSWEGSSWDTQIVQASLIYSDESASRDLQTAQASSMYSDEFPARDMQTAQALSLHSDEFAAGGGSSHSGTSYRDIRDQSRI